MAGLPLFTSRHSAERCAKSGPRVATGLSFTILQELSRALVGPPRTASLAVDQVKAYLVKKKRKKPGPAIPILREQFYYLRIAIEFVYSQNPPKSAVSFRVSAEFGRRTCLRTPYDQVMQEEETLF